MRAISRSSADIAGFARVLRAGIGSVSLACRPDSACRFICTCKCMCVCMTATACHPSAVPIAPVYEFVNVSVYVCMCVCMTACRPTAVLTAPVYV